MASVAGWRGTEWLADTERPLLATLPDIAASTLATRERLIPATTTANNLKTESTNTGPKNATTYHNFFNNYPIIIILVSFCLCFNDLLFVTTIFVTKDRQKFCEQFVNSHTINFFQTLHPSISAWTTHGLPLITSANKMTTVLIRRNAPTDSCHNLTAARKLAMYFNDM